MQQYTIEFLKLAHKSTFGGKGEIIFGDLCGCFDCKTTFDSSEITEWIEEPDGRETVACPKCGTDSVLSSKWPVDDPQFLEAMHSYWF